MSFEKRHLHQFDGFMPLAIFILLFVLPVAAIWLLGAAVIEQSAANQRLEQEQRLEQQAESICKQLDRENFFTDLFDRFYHELYQGDNIDGRRITKLIEQFDVVRLGVFPAIFVDGQLVTPPAFLQEHMSALIEAWKNTHGYTTLDRYTSSKYLNTLFGARYSLFTVRQHEGRIMKFNGFRGDGYLYYRRQPNKPDSERPGGVFLVVWSLPPLSSLIDYLPAEATAGLSVKLQLRGSMPHIEDSSLLIVRKKIGDRFLLVGKKYNGLDPRQAITLLKIFLLILAMLLVMLVRDSNLSGILSRLSVKMKLVGLIMYAVLLPLSGMLYFGWKYLAENRELLLQDAYLACQSSITEIENGFDLEKARMLQFFRSFKEQPEMKSDPTQLQEKFRKLDIEKRINWVEVRDMDAEVLMTIQRKETAQQIGLLGKAIARKGIDNFLGHRLGARKEVLEPSEVLVQEFLEGPFGGWARIFESPDELHQVSFGGFEILWYWDVFENPEMKAAFIVVDQHVRWAVRHYLAQRLQQRVSFKSGVIRNFAWSHIASEMWPADGEAIDELRAFVRQVARSNTSQNNIIRWKNRDWVAAGAPGKKLTDTVLLALYPLSEIDREIAVIRSDLTWGVLFALILALLVGSLFSQTILQPVSRLMVGVQALRRRDAGLRLEILHNDELGKLSATFNKTSEALADILSAKAIQTQLIPENAPEIPGFMADLIYLPAAELGGDYCDILPLTDSRWLLVIGDVTGHGVSSAMVTTMIKAVVIDYAMRGEFELSEMFLCLNELLYTQFRRKKCMTLLAAVIDCNSGQIDCVNSGHPLPLHFSGGKRQTLSVSGRPPLGFSTRNLEFPKFSIALQPDDCLVFYTDILIETVDCHGKPYGSDGLAAICSSFLHLSPSSMLNGIVDVVKSGVGGEFDDDLTLMIIKRKTYDEVKHAG